MLLTAMVSRFLQLRILALVFAVCSLSLLSGCFVRSESEVIGVYELVNGTGKITLAVRGDHTFTETVSETGAKPVSRSGKWRWTGLVSFDSLWIPAEFAPRYILEADAKTSPGFPKHTEPGPWSLEPGRSFGHVTLTVFSEGDSKFQMVGER